MESFTRRQPNADPDIYSDRSYDSLALVISANVDNLQSHTLPVLVSDSLPPTALHMWLARCPSAENTLLLSSSVVACSISSESPVNAHGSFADLHGLDTDVRPRICAKHRQLQRLEPVSVRSPCLCVTRGALQRVDRRCTALYNNIRRRFFAPCLLLQRSRAC